MKNKKITVACILAASAFFVVGCTTKDLAEVNEGTEINVDIEGTDIENTEDIYSVCTDYSREEVESFASAVKKEILDGDWNALAENIAYPIEIGGQSYDTAEAFLAAELDAVFTEDFCKAIETEDCYMMFCNDEGIMFADGELWISEVLDDDQNSLGLKVTAINVN